jgi:hypothetical protein
MKQYNDIPIEMLNGSMDGVISYLIQLKNENKIPEKEIYLDINAGYYNVYCPWYCND